MRERDDERWMHQRARHLSHLEDIDELYDELELPAEQKLRGRQRAGRSHTRGRLTEEARERLARERVEAAAPADGPPVGDRWSSWRDAELHGPEPLPDWVLVEAAAIDTDLGVIKTGKEADVFLLERSLPEADRWTLLAAKRYRDAGHRLFHRDAGYLEGRRMRKTREQRAVENRTNFGRNLIAQQWSVAEFEALSVLWSAGLPVPYPVQCTGPELLVEFVGTAEGVAAPRLAELRPRGAELEELWAQLLDALRILTHLGYAHGDLSAYNVLVHEGELVLIDLPQLVDLVANPQGRSFLDRDVRNVCGWFAGQGLAGRAADPDALLADLLAEAGLG